MESPFDDLLDDLSEPSTDAVFVFRRRGFDAACESDPGFELRAFLDCRLPEDDESRTENSDEGSNDRWRRACFDPSELPRVGESTLLLSKEPCLDFGICFTCFESFEVLLSPGVLTGLTGASAGAGCETSDAVLNSFIQVGVLADGPSIPICATCFTSVGNPI